MCYKHELCKQQPDGHGHTCKTVWVAQRHHFASVFFSTGLDCCRCLAKPKWSLAKKCIEEKSPTIGLLKSAPDCCLSIIPSCPLYFLPCLTFPLPFLHPGMLPPLPPRDELQEACDGPPAGAGSARAGTELAPMLTWLWALLIGFTANCNVECWWTVQRIGPSGKPSPSQ